MDAADLNPAVCTWGKPSAAPARGLMTPSQRAAPSADELALSERLSERIRATIAARGPLPFRDYMQMCLYEPGLGYYSNPLPKFGLRGDFVTAPELGDWFAQALASHLAPLLRRDPMLDLVEVGGGSGALAARLLPALAAHQAEPRRYRMVEPNAGLRQRQQERLQALAAPLRERVDHLPAPPSDAWRGVLIANEVLDALPVERFRVTGDGLARLAVASSAGAFSWSTVAHDAHTMSAVAALASELRISTADGSPWLGYESEFAPDLAPLLARWLAPLVDGVALLIDYGHARDAYYHIDRRGGTLVAHRQHRASFDPFEWPGLLDLSAFVDFTAAARATCELGFDLLAYATQAEALLVAPGMAERLAAADAKQRAQLRLLLLPGEMGERFRWLIAGRGSLAALVPTLVLPATLRQL